MNRDQEKIADFVCRKFGVTFSQLIAKTRLQFIHRARATFIFLLREHGYCCSWIAHVLNRDIHVIYRSCRHIEDELSLPDTNDKLNQLIKETVKEWNENYDTAPGT